MALRLTLCTSLVMLWSATQNGAWLRCGPLKSCRCFPATGIISCRDAGLRRMPLLKAKGYTTLDLRGNDIEELGSFDVKRFGSIDLRDNPLNCVNPPHNVRHDPCQSGQPPKVSPTVRHQPAPPLTVVTNEDGTMIIVFGACGAGGAGLIVTLIMTAIWLHRRGLLHTCIRNVVRRAADRDQAERPPSEASDWADSLGGEPMIIVTSEESEDVTDMDIR